MLVWVLTPAMLQSFIMAAQAPAPAAAPAVSSPPATGNDGSITLTLHKVNSPTIGGPNQTALMNQLIVLYGTETNTSCSSANYASCPNYIIVNLVDWSKPTAPVSTWSLVRPQDIRSATLDSPTIDDSTRIYGSRSVGLLVVHTNIPAAITGGSYTITSKGKQSVELTDLLALLKILGVAAGPGPAQALVGARALNNITKLPADVTITGQLAASDASGTSGAQNFTKTYDNEGFSHWDISIGIPVTGIKDVEYASDGTVQAKNVSKATAYGMAHFYPYSVDLKGNYPWYPSIVGGLSLTGQPLDKPFAGLSTGIRKPLPISVNFFAGAVFNKVFSPATLKVGSSASSLQLQSDLKSHRVTKLLYGIDIPITQFVKAISGSGTKVTTTTKTGQ